ncbi:hypothetical protein BHE74_00057058, partial [Ensete ventricosum]
MGLLELNSFVIKEALLLAYAGPTSNVRVERASRDCYSDGGALVEVISLYETTDDNGLVAVNDTENGDRREEGYNHPTIEVFLFISIVHKILGVMTNIIF